MVQRAEDLVCRRQKTAGDATCHHFTIAENGCAADQGLCCHFGKSGRGVHVVDNVGHATGMDQANSDVRQPAINPGQIRRFANDGEGSGINLRRVFQIAPHSHPSSVRLAVRLGW